MIYVVGMGPGAYKYMTYDAVEKIKLSDRVIAFGRISRTAKEIRSDVIEVKRVDEIIRNLDTSLKTAILASGDPCFYGIIEYLKNKGINIDEIIPGLSSFQYLMTRIKKSWNGANLISLHGREEDINTVLNNKVSVILTDKNNNPNFISKTLSQKGCKGKIYVGYNLSYENENIIIKNIGDEIEDVESISVVVVENEMD